MVTPLLPAGATEQATAYLAQFAKFLVGLLLTYFAGRLLLLPAIHKGMDRRGVGPTVKKPVIKVARVAILIAGITVGLTAAGMGNFLSSVTVLASALTLALGFAAQDVLSNFVAGVFIVSDPTIKIGDWIEWDGNEGKIEDISFRVTRVRTFNNELITVPNSDLANSALTNPVAHDRLRITQLFGIGYDDDIDHAKQVLIEEAEKIDGVLHDPGPSVRLTELADSYVGLKARLWIENPARSDFASIKSEYLQTIKERFDEENIEMPYPYTELTGGIEVEEKGEKKD